MADALDAPDQGAKVGSQGEVQGRRGEAGGAGRSATQGVRQEPRPEPAVQCDTHHWPARLRDHPLEKHCQIHPQVGLLQLLSSTYEVPVYQVLVKGTPMKYILATSISALMEGEEAHFY